ncbi:MAG: hypothetical protein K2K34_08455 [Oscillospiraceae bacterium]|nr:hypothetical protein [Oscillospiraceae bacterium]
MKKSVKIILFAVAFAIVTAAAVLGLAVKKYLDEVPIITSKSPVYAEIGSTISIADLADIEWSVSSRISSIEWQAVGSGDTTNAEIIDNGQSLFVGDYTGSLDVTVHATGKNSESRSEKVTVEVYIAD